MTQYCRYCKWLVGWHGIYCDKHACRMSEAQAKHTNRCKDFDMYVGPAAFMDALCENKNGYRPRREKIRESELPPTLSCESCRFHGKECDSSAYEGKHGYVAGDDWCELYAAADDWCEKR